MEEILHHLGCIKPCKEWDKPPINWCRISSINSISAHEPARKKHLGNLVKHSAQLHREFFSSYGFQHESVGFYPARILESFFHPRKTIQIETKAFLATID